MSPCADAAPETPNARLFGHSCSRQLDRDTNVADRRADANLVVCRETVSAFGGPVHVLQLQAPGDSLRVRTGAVEKAVDTRLSLKQVHREPVFRSRNPAGDPRPPRTQHP